MTTYFVSKNGNNANSGLSLELAKRTMFDASANAGAYEAASDGDTIIFDDGFYSGSEIEASAGVGYLLTAKGIRLDSVNPYGATLASTSTSAVVRCNVAFASKTLSFGKINLDGDGVIPNYGIWFAPTSGPAGLDIGDVRVIQSSIYAVNQNAANTVQVIVTGGGDLTATRAGFDCITLGSSSSVTLSGTKVTTTAKTVARPAINIIQTGSGSSAQVLEPVVNIAHDATFPVQGDGGVLIKNIDNALIYKPSVTITTASASGTIVGAQIDCDSGTLTAHRGNIIGGNLSLDANGGIGAVYGHDTTGNAGDNRCNFGVIRGVKLSGGSKFIAGLGHGIMLGNNQDCQAFGNTVNLSGIGVLMKGTTRARFNSNTAKMCSSSFVQFKGAVDSTADGNDFYLDGAAGSGVVANVNGAVNCTGCTATGNVFHINESFTSLLIAINPSQTLTMNQNIYNILSGAAVANPIASVAGVSYATINDYLTAIEPTGKVISDRTVPSLTGGNGSTSGFYLEVAPGVNLPL